MAVNKNPKITPVSIPVSNINAYIRVPGQPPFPLAQALQEWDGINTAVYRVSEPETPNEFRYRHEVVFRTDQGQFKIPVSEMIYETALYTLAARRFGDWMKANKEQVQNAVGGAA